MANSPLLGGDRAARRPAGTGTDALGPSDTSDSGSDITGAVGAVDTEDLGFDGGSNDDIRRAPGAGADIGDANLDGSSDSGGTGERAEAGRDTLQREAPDLLPDQVFGPDEGLDTLDDIDDLSASDADEGEDTDEDDNDLDDGLTARPPAESARPGRQRNSDRAVASGEERAAPDDADRKSR